MAFFVDGASVSVAVRTIVCASVTSSVEHCGELQITFSAIDSTHSHRMILLQKMMTETFLTAARHAHDGEYDAE